VYLVTVCKMPSSLLFAINNEGRVFGLSTTGTKWREFVYLGLEFKHLSAVPHFMWAVGGDRQVYVHVHGLDIPIRIKEEAYENEVMCRCTKYREHNDLFICSTLEYRRDNFRCYVEPYIIVHSAIPQNTVMFVRKALLTIESCSAIVS
jgi:hypothetical protein